MCLFPFPNKKSIKALVKGIEKFECGGCPECLQKKSRQWALRCAMEAKSNVGFMCTLTYDSYKNGKDGEENPVNPNLPLSKAHAQRFIKRLRKHFPNNDIKYLLSAERGKKTRRAHYHALIFGVQFDDLRFYKKSDRGNKIYKSPTLDKIWSSDKEHNGGICTVDCVNPSAQVARYCTKYCAKDSGIDDTFMLFSRGIGDEELLKRFNGKSYWIDGREYSIPRQIWQKVIEEKYKLYTVEVDKNGNEHKKGFSRYVGKNHLYESGKRLCSKLDKISAERDKIQTRLLRLNISLYRHESLRPRKRGFRSFSTRQWWLSRFNDICDKIDECEKLLELNEDKRQAVWKESCGKMSTDKSYNRAVIRRETYQATRDSDILYKRYLSYWKRKNEINELVRPDEETRIALLPVLKYWSYRNQAVIAKISQRKKFDFVPPRSRSQGFVKFPSKNQLYEQPFAPLSRHYWANDTDINLKLSLFGFEMVNLSDIYTGEVDKIYILPKFLKKPM